MEPIIVHGLVLTRSHLTGVLRAFDRAAGYFAFGRHRHPEAVILPWGVFESLADAALTLDSVSITGDLLRRQRHPGGATRHPLAVVADLLQVPDLSPDDRDLFVWPPAIDDLVRLSDELPLVTRRQLHQALGDLPAGVALAGLPGQASFDGRRIDLDAGLTVVLDMAGAVVAVTKTGHLLRQLQELSEVVVKAEAPADAAQAVPDRDPVEPPAPADP